MIIKRFIQYPDHMHEKVSPDGGCPIFLNFYKAAAPMEQRENLSVCI